MQIGGGVKGLLRGGEIQVEVPGGIQPDRADRQRDRKTELAFSDAPQLAGPTARVSQRRPEGKRPTKKNALRGRAPGLPLQ